MWIPNSVPEKAVSVVNEKPSTTFSQFSETPQNSVNQFHIDLPRYMSSEKKLSVEEHVWDLGETAATLQEQIQTTPSYRDVQKTQAKTEVFLRLVHT